MQIKKGTFESINSMESISYTDTPDDSPPGQTVWYDPVYHSSSVTLCVDLCARPVQTEGVYSIWRISGDLLVMTEYISGA